MPKRTKKILSLVVALAVLFGGGALLYGHLAGANAGALAFKTQAAQRSSIVTTVTATGTLSPLKTVLVGSQVSGRVLELHADFNSEVKKGDVIARLDPQLLQGEVARAEANLKTARANLTKAQATLVDARQKNGRAQRLAAEKLVAQADADSANATEKAAAAGRTAAEADVSQAEAALAQAKVNLSYTTVVSPIDGVVISRDVDVGQTVAASLSAPTLFTIAEDMRAMEVHTSVAESDVGALTAGMRVEFTVDAFPEERFAGEVTQIRNKASTVQNVVTYDAVVRVDNAELKLRPGMTANVTFVVAEKDGVLAVPNAALRFRPANAARGGERGADRGTVWVLAGKEPVPVRVTTGISDGKVTEIVTGELAEGAAVIVSAGGGGAATPAAGAGGSGGQGRRNGAGNRPAGGLGL